VPAAGDMIHGRLVAYILRSTGTKNTTVTASINTTGSHDVSNHK